jgi:endonuclease/exonuclease/phosphatase family metal-dependent hydrolase
MGTVPELLSDFFSQHKDVDIFCLQEVYKGALSHPRPDLKRVELELFERIQEQLVQTHVGYFRPSVGDYYGIALFVRIGLEVVEEGAVSIYENLNWKNDSSDRGNHSRILQYIKIQTPDGPLLVVHVHGLWKLGAGKADLPERIEQSKRIAQFLSKYNEKKVLIGDFNLDPDTESLAIVEQGMRNLIKEYKITSTRTRFYEKEGKFADYALVTPDVAVKDFKVLPDEVSDHAALYLEIG